MGKQSSRIYYKEKDHKDIFFKGTYHQKMFKGKNLVWEKLYRYFLWSSYFSIFDLDSKNIIKNKSEIFSLSNVKNNLSYGLGELFNKETNERCFGITKDGLIWVTIKEIDIWSKSNSYNSGVFSTSLTENGFFIYQTGRNKESGERRTELYLISIEPNLEYEVKNIYSSKIFFRYVQQYGISDSFYAIQHDQRGDYTIYRIKKDGSVSSQKMLGNFLENGVIMDYGGMGILANDNGDIYILCPETNANNGGTYIFHASGLSNADYPTISFSARNSSFLGVAKCGIDIVYNSYQTMFIAHGERKTHGGITQDIISSYKKSEFYEIDAAGNTLRILQKDSADGDMYVKCIGLEGVDVLGIRFSQEGIISSQNVDPKITGYIYYQDIVKGISSGGETSLEIGYDKSRNDKCFIGYYFWREDMTSVPKRMVIYFDNLFWRESENNFAVVVEEE